MRLERLVVAGLLACMSSAWAAPEDVDRGRRLFVGTLPLAGRIAGHTSDLPAQASRCVNCHAAGTAAPTAAPGSSAGTPRGPASVPAPSFGPTLSADGLMRDSPRRGGPPSRYDEAALCKLLSTGVDPAYIIIPRTMPRYDLSATDCHALWSYLSQRQP